LILYKDVSRINFAIITLIPKEPEAKDMKKFRPISLCNCSLNRLSPIGHRIIAPTQTTFLKGRFILESVVSVHEVIHFVHSHGESGVVLKLDYEKAYDRVDWSFLDSMLASKRFGPIIRG
jgi:hypothetical protein